MAVFQIPLPTEIVPNFSIQMDLDGTTYSIAFEWSKRGGGWHVHLYNEDESAAIVLGAVLELRAVLFAGVLPGYIAVNGPEPLPTDMAGLSTVQLLYVDAASSVGLA